MWSGNSDPALSSVSIKPTKGCLLPVCYAAQNEYHHDKSLRWKPLWEIADCRSLRLRGTCLQKALKRWILFEFLSPVVLLTLSQRLDEAGEGLGGNS